MRVGTLQVPRLDPVEIHLLDDVEVDLLGGHLPSEIVPYQLLLRGVEPEPWGHRVAGRLLHCPRHTS